MAHDMHKRIAQLDILLTAFGAEFACYFGTAVQAVSFNAVFLVAHGRGKRKVKVTASGRSKNSHPVKMHPKRLTLVYIFAWSGVMFLLRSPNDGYGGGGVRLETIREVGTLKTFP